MGSIATMLAQCSAPALGYAEALVKDVTPSIFARLPEQAGKRIGCNHPAWVYGHLGLYHSSCMDLMGLPQGVTARLPDSEALFKNGTECLDDPAGKIYPAMDVLVPHCINGLKAVRAALVEVSDDTLLRANPMGGRMTEMFPTVGAAVNFLLTGHTLIHFGQISTWRRAMGLGSAM